MSESKGWKVIKSACWVALCAIGKALDTVMSEHEKVPDGLKGTKRDSNSEYVIREDIRRQSERHHDHHRRSR